MKILIVLDDYFNQTNGMCISTQRFVREFRQEGQQVRILSTSSQGQADYPVPELIIPFFRRIIAKESFRLAVPVKKQIRQAVAWADIVLIETPFPLSWLSAKYARQQKKAVIATFHLYPGNITETLHINDRFWNHFFMSFFKNVSFRNATAIQCPTLAVKQQLLKNHFHQQLYVNSNGISQEFIDNPHKSYVGKPFLILCIGRFSAEKHQEVLFKALQYSKHARQIQLIFAGQGPLAEKYRRLAAQLPVKPILKFYQPTELRKIMAKADLVVHCADVEIEGMACMEAFAAGLVPVIAESPMSSTAAYALSQHNLFPVNDSQALAKQIDYWYEHPEALKKNQAQYRQLSQKLTVARSAARYWRMMEKLQKEKTNSINK